MIEDKKLLFIPAYNCQEQILRLINNLKPEHISNFDKILIIDNLSEDHTSKYAKQAVLNKGFKTSLL